MTRKGRLIVGAALAVVLLIGAVVAAFVLFFSSDAPERANLDDARRGAASTTKPSGPTSAPPATLDGTWTVDTSIGDFSEFTSAWAGYRIDEELGSIGANTAAGRTPDVSGELTISGTSISDASITVDMTTLQSDRSLRDNALKSRGLETDTFPEATFVLTEPIELAEVPAADVTIQLEATGDLTLHGVTKRVTIPLEASLVGGTTIAVTGHASIALADYGIEKPTSASVLSIKDNGELELQLLFTRA